MRQPTMVQRQLRGKTPPCGSPQNCRRKDSGRQERMAIFEEHLVPVWVNARHDARRVELATCSGVRFQPTAPRFYGNCSSFRAPTITLATVSRCNSQLSAICGTNFPPRGTCDSFGRGGGSRRASRKVFALPQICAIGISAGRPLGVFPFVQPSIQSPAARDPRSPLSYP